VLRIVKNFAIGKVAIDISSNLIRVVIFPMNGLSYDLLIVNSYLSHTN